MAINVPIQIVFSTTSKFTKLTLKLFCGMDSFHMSLEMMFPFKGLRTFITFKMVFFMGTHNMSVEIVKTCESGTTLITRKRHYSEINSSNQSHLYQTL